MFVRLFPIWQKTLDTVTVSLHVVVMLLIPVGCLFDRHNTHFRRDWQPFDWILEWICHVASTREAPTANELRASP